MNAFRFRVTWAVALLAAGFFAVTGAQAAALAEFSNKDAVAALKEALVKGSQVAVQQLGTENGYFKNELVRIPLPDSLKAFEALLRGMGMDRYADELVLRMNRAAEAAVPEAKAMLVNAIRQMSVQDAKTILTGGNDAATQYFRRTTSEPLAQKFRPIVKKSMAKVRIAEKYDELAKTGARFGLVAKDDVNLETYITRKALDGLYTMIAEEEKKIRADPVGAASGIISKVFGALGKR